MPQANVSHLPGDSEPQLNAVSFPQSAQQHSTARFIGDKADKERLFELATKAISLVWHAIDRGRKIAPQSLGLFQSKGPFWRESWVEYLTHEQILNKLPPNSDLRPLIHSIRKLTDTTLTLSTSKETFLAIVEGDTFKLGGTPALSREEIEEYKALLRVGAGDSQTNAIYQHLMVGFLSASRLFWKTSEVIAPTFKAQFGRSIDADTFLSIQRGLTPLLVEMGCIHLLVLESIEAAHSSVLNEDWDWWKSEAFILQSNGERNEEGLRLKFRPEVFNAPEIIPLASTPRLGCPSFRAKGQSGQSVFYEVLDWFQEISTTFLAPRLKVRSTLDT